LAVVDHLRAEAAFPVVAEVLEAVEAAAPGNHSLPLLHKALLEKKTRMVKHFILSFLHKFYTGG
jgi:hypothetical protein